ncbi:calcium-binding protein [uncultured Arcobacter sp.]|uniref:calcium-binding protein n=1 Tax=uncultured Arcobacter sp. TaxID=165434 RepID=UPI00260BD194|nr:calcium-binding protein [uncultured Arcobacter sp.]
MINSSTSTGILAFDGYARSVSMSIKSFDGTEGKDTGTVELLRDGVVIETYSLNDYLTTNPSGSIGIPLTFTSDVYFNEVRVSNTSTNDQFQVKDVTLVSPYLVTYSIDASATVTDDGEILSNLILKVPSSLDGVLVVDGFAPNAILSADGDYNYYSIPADNESVELIFDFVDELTATELTDLGTLVDTITGSATSWESGDGFALAASSGSDTIAGTTEDNEIFGEEGDDVIFGGDGTDTLYGGDGDDTIAGEVGDDYIDGGAGADALYGGAGNDTIEYDTLDTLIDAGDGSDALIGNAETINLANVDNIEVIQLSSGATVIGTGDANAINPSDVMDATDGNNTLVIESSDEGAYTINVDTTLLQFSENVDGYNIYTDDTVTLKIEDSIIVE